jgi:hypothetical protein
MQILRRTLYVQAAVWTFAGLSLAIAPELVLVTIFGQPRFQEFAWQRIVGLQAVGLAMLMVLVAHRIEDVWWWSWAFALVTTAMAAVTLLNVAFGLGPHQPAGLWWLLSAIFVLFALSLLIGLYAASQEQPNPG